MSRWAHRLAAAFGFLAVALGAFGAHALKPTLTLQGTTSLWATAVLYHLTHSIAALWASEKRPLAALLWLGGVFLFSGSLYALALTGQKIFGPLTPLGGLFLLAGWLVALLPPKH